MIVLAVPYPAFLPSSIGLCFGGKSLRPAGRRDSALPVPPEGLPQQSVPFPWEQDPLALGRPNRRGTKRRHKCFARIESHSSAFSAKTPRPASPSTAPPTLGFPSRPT